MAGMGQPAVERLREFLRELTPGARALLIAELERTMLRGEDMAGAELILAELRRSMHEGRSTSQRIGHHARLFFNPIEPFVVDDVADHKHCGRIARSALEPIWLWLSNTVMPGEAKTFAEQVEEALPRRHRQANTSRAAFQESATTKLEDLLAVAASDDKTRRRINGQLGTPRALEDIKTLVGVLKARDQLAMMGTQLPGHIKTLTGASLENVKAQLDSKLQSHPDMLVYALVVVMGRLAASWQLIRLATKAAGSDTAARIAETPYNVTVPMVLTEIARMVAELNTDLKSERGIAVTALLRDIHDALRGLRSELDLSGDSAWAKQLATTRAEISKLLPARSTDARPRTTPDASPPGQGDRAGLDGRCGRGGGSGVAGRFRDGLPQLRERTCDQRNHAAHLHRIAAMPRCRHQGAARCASQFRRR